jgi:RimJ/RimL family protein N-acetyltransferase
MYLRKISESDAPDLIRWRNANAGFFPPRDEPLGWAEHARWYLNYLKNLHDHMYVVCVKDPGYDDYELPIGTIAIDARTKTIQRVMRGRPEGKGAMAEAVHKLMCEYGSGTYQLSVLDTNKHAIEFYERLGFHRAGRWYRSHLVPKPHALICMVREFKL